MTARLINYVEDDPTYRNAWPTGLEQMYGAGCTDGELCLRFSSEDLRKPIIHENALDESILKDLIEKHRLKDWFAQACRAGRKAYEEEKDGGQQQPEAIAAEAEEPPAVPETELISESVEIAASETFEGDDEQSVAEQDVEMQDS